MDKAKEAIKARNKQKFATEISRTIEDIKKLQYSLVNIAGNISNAEDIDVDSFSILNGIRRDVLLDIQNTDRIEKLLRIGGSSKSE